MVLLILLLLLFCIPVNENHPFGHSAYSEMSFCKCIGVPRIIPTFCAVSDGPADDTDIGLFIMTRDSALYSGRQKI